MMLKDQIKNRQQAIKNLVGAIEDLMLPEEVKFRNALPEPERLKAEAAVEACRENLSKERLALAQLLGRK